jgi:hypothetical protein
MKPTSWRHQRSYMQLIWSGPRLEEICLFCGVKFLICSGTQSRSPHESANENNFPATLMVQIF